MAKKNEVAQNEVIATDERKERKRGAALVLPSYSLKAIATGDTLAIRIDSEIETKPDIDQKTGKQKADKKGEPAVMRLVNVTDLDSGIVGQMVLPFIIHQAFAKFPKLAGLEFELVKGKAEANKATMWEIYPLV
jgi:hypothetical protein